MSAPDVVALAGLVGRALSRDEVLLVAAAHQQGLVTGRDQGIGLGLERAMQVIEKEAHRG